MSGRIQVDLLNLFRREHNLTSYKLDYVSSYLISVHSSKPVLACLGSQYAGWSLSHDNFFSLGSGPVRSIVQKEEKEG